MTRPLDEREREELCDLFLELGPEAATLCEGWTSTDLAAHLVLQEHFHRWDGARMADAKSEGCLPSSNASVKALPSSLGGCPAFVT